MPNWGPINDSCQLLQSGAATLQTDSFRSWLKPRGLSPSTVNTYISDAKRVERDYGDLDELCAKNRLAEVLQELQRDGLGGYKTAVNLYCKYR